MKIVKRIIFGTAFIPMFFIVLFIICPVSWIITGDFEYKLHEFIDFYQNL